MRMTNQVLTTLEHLHSPAVVPDEVQIAQSRETLDVLQLGSNRRAESDEIVQLKEEVVGSTGRVQPYLGARHTRI